MQPAASWPGTVLFPARLGSIGTGGPSGRGGGPGARPGQGCPDTTDPPQNASRKTVKLEEALSPVIPLLPCVTTFISLSHKNYCCPGLPTATHGRLSSRRRDPPAAPLAAPPDIPPAVPPLSLRCPSVVPGARCAGGLAPCRELSHRHCTHSQTRRTQLGFVRNSCKYFLRLM